MQDFFHQQHHPSDLFRLSSILSQENNMQNNYSFLGKKSKLIPMSKFQFCAQTKLCDKNPSWIWYTHLQKVPEHNVDGRKNQPLGMYKHPRKNRINYQPQLVSARFLSSTVSPPKKNVVFKGMSKIGEIGSWSKCIQSWKFTRQKRYAYQKTLNMILSGKQKKTMEYPNFQ